MWVGKVKVVQISSEMSRMVAARSIMQGKRQDSKGVEAPLVQQKTSLSREE
jgi:hypothetical protein